MSYPKTSKVVTGQPFRVLTSKPITWFACLLPIWPINQRNVLVPRYELDCRSETVDFLVGGPFIKGSLPYWSYNKWRWLERWHIDLLYTLFVLRNAENPPSLEKKFLTPKSQRRLGRRLLKSPSYCDSDRLGFVSQPEGVVGLTQTKR